MRTSSSQIRFIGWLLVGSLAWVALLWSAPAAAGAVAVGSPVVTPRARLSHAYGQLPLSFEPNHGQAGGRVEFLARGNGYSLHLAGADATLLLPAGGQRSKPASVRLQFVGARSGSRITGLDELPGKINYFIGVDQSRWRTNIPTYAKVRYPDLYPGVDVVFYGHRGQVEYDLVVAPGADPGAITLELSGLGRPRVDAGGDVVLSDGSGEVRLHKPVIYQDADGGRRPVAGRYVLHGRHRLKFAVAAYDRSRALVIDPVIVYSTYLGGASAESFPGVAVDALGNAYLAGDTLSTDYPTVNPLQPPRGSRFVVVSKLNATGSALVYSTYLGGSPNEQAASTANNGLGAGVAVDGVGNVYVTGFTNSNNFPVTATAFQPSLAGEQDVFLTKLNPAGNAILYSTYLGGSGSETARRVAVDDSGKAWIAGATDSANFPVKNAAQPLIAGGADAFAAKLDTAQSGAASLVWSTYLGGSADDSQFGSLSNAAVAVDAVGNAYVAGGTRSFDFPVLNALQPTHLGGVGTIKCFVTKLTATGALAYSTYLGGSANEACFDVAVDAAGHAHVTGFTNSQNFPLKDPLYPTSIIAQGGEDGFVTKLSADGSKLVFSTFLMGPGVNGSSRGQAIALGPDGRVHVTGRTMASNLQLKDPVQNVAGGNFDAFVTVLNNTGTALVFNTYLGGTLQESGTGLAVGPAGSVFVAGRTQSLNYPTKNPLQGVHQGGQFDHFLTKIGFPTANLALTGIIPERGGDAGEVTAFIQATGLTEGATVRLVRAGQPDIGGSGPEVTDLGLVLTATFDLRGKARGAYDVVVTNGDGAPVSLPGGFTVEAPEPPQLYMRVVGRRAIRLGSELTDYLQFGNSGNADQHDVPVFLSLPNFVAFIPAVDLPYQFAADGPSRTLITFPVPLLPAGRSERVPFKILVADPNQLEHVFDIRASIGHPYILPGTADSSPASQAGRETAVVTAADTPCTCTNICTCACHQVPISSQNMGPSGCTTPRASLDPNDKVGVEGIDTARFVMGRVELPYAVYFENLPAASLPARDVVITDQLDPALFDFGTFSLGPIAFGDRLVTPPAGQTQFTTDVDLRPAQQLFVRVTAGLDTDTGVITWRFNSIDPATGSPPDDPTVGFLPPNVHSPDGQGSVLFGVKPRPELASGTAVTNQATVVFDANPPIATPLWVNTIDIAKPSSQVSLPASSCETFTVPWSGIDADSGVAAYTVFVSDNGGPFVPFVSDTPATSAIFPGQFGHTYRFYSVATDNVGNVESVPAAPDATTTVDTALALSATSQSFSALGGSGGVDVIGPASCGWDVASHAAFLTVTSGATGAGNGTVSFTVAPNGTPAPRAGTLTIAGRTFTALQGAHFDDVADDGSVFSSSIGRLSARGITGGCAPTSYCPDDPVTREQMAIFLLRAIHGPGFAPPPATGTVFIDVPATDLFARWIEQLAREGITGGCSSSPPQYCPDDTVTRGQMSVFLLRSKYGAAFQPPPAVGTFADVPPGHVFAGWIEQLAREGITGGCQTQPALYCPDDPVTRAQMAVFMVRAFNL
jgi:hypothetical protein